MTDVRLTALNPVDSQVYPVACNTSGELLVADGGPDLTVTGDLTVDGTASFNNDDVNIDSSGRLGIGTSSPSANLYIAQAATKTGGDINASADGLVVDNSGGNTGLTFKTPNTASSRICFGDPEDNNAGQILYNHSGNSLAIDTSGSERMRIDSSGLDVNGTGNFTGDVTAPNITTLNALVDELQVKLSLILRQIDISADTP
jgi:hypothetical protein